MRVRPGPGRGGARRAGATGWGGGSPEPETASRPFLPREDAISARGDCGTGRAVPGVWAGKAAGGVRLAAGRRAGGLPGGRVRRGCEGWDGPGRGRPPPRCPPSPPSTEPTLCPRASPVPPGRSPVHLLHARAWGPGAEGRARVGAGALLRPRPGVCVPRREGCWSGGPGSLPASLQQSSRGPRRCGFSYL